MCLQGEHWTAAMKGHEVQAGAAEEDRKRLLLERFQMEVRPLLARLRGALPCAGQYAGLDLNRHPFGEPTPPAR